MYTRAITTQSYANVTNTESTSKLITEEESSKQIECMPNSLFNHQPSSNHLCVDMNLHKPIHFLLTYC